MKNISFEKSILEKNLLKISERNRTKKPKKSLLLEKNQLTFWKRRLITI